MTSPDASDPIIKEHEVPDYTGEPFGILEFKSVNDAIKAQDVLIKRGHWTARWDTRLFISVTPV
jgi:hypothetical protein